MAEVHQGCGACGAPAVNNRISHKAGCCQLGDERVDHPTHYNEHPSGIECITIAEHMGFNIGNAMKYLWRAGRKDSTPTDDDLRKAIWYIERERQRLAKTRAT